MPEITDPLELEITNTMQELDLGGLGQGAFLDVLGNVLGGIAKRNKDANPSVDGNVLEEKVIGIAKRIFDEWRKKDLPRVPNWLEPRLEDGLWLLIQSIIRKYL